MTRLTKVSKVKATARPVYGERPPSFPSKATLAAELDISVSTVDEWVKQGILPPPIKRGGSVRWCWAQVVASLEPSSEVDDDPFMKAVSNVS